MARCHNHLSRGFRCDIHGESVLKTRSFSSIIAFGLLALANMAWADSDWSLTLTQPDMASHIRDLQRDQQQGGQWVEAVVVFDARTAAHPAQTTAAPLVTSPLGGPVATNLYNALVAPSHATGLIPANNAQYFAALKAAAPSMQLPDKFALLSNLGTALGNCYTEGSSPYTGVSQQAQFTALRSGATTGCGVCRDAGEYLAQAAANLGFIHTGVFTGLEGPSSPSDYTGAHAVAFMQDPSSKEYYVQNWSHIFDTYEKTLTRADDMATSVLGVLTGTSAIESKPGVVHLYQPRTARWVTQGLTLASQFDGDRTPISLTLGNREQNMLAQVGNDNVKAFLLHSDYQTSGGAYSLTAIGVAGREAKDWNYSKGPLQRISLLAEGYLGALYISDPSYNDPDTPRPYDWRINAFAGMHLAGEARINPITAKLEIRANMVDIGAPGAPGAQNVTLPPMHQINAGVTYSPDGKPYRIEARRTMELSMVTIADQNPKLRTAYDRISLIIDTRSGKNVPYIVNETGIYFFGGMENMDAIGIKEHFRATVPTENLGDFYVIFDGSKIVANRAQDPFYEDPGSLAFGTGWTDRITHALTVGAEVDVTNGNTPFFLFEEPGTVTPEMGQLPAFNVIGQVWLGGQF